MSDADAVRAGWSREADEVPLPARQRFLDGLWAGLSVGKARDAAGISFDAAMGLMELNIERHEFSTLRKVAL